MPAEISSVSNLQCKQPHNAVNCTKGRTFVHMRGRERPPWRSMMCLGHHRLRWSLRSITQSPHRLPPRADFRPSTFDLRPSTFDFRLSTFDFRLSTFDFLNKERIMTTTTTQIETNDHSSGMPSSRDFEIFRLAVI